MTERQEVEVPAADSYPRKILEYMEGFLISKVGEVIVGHMLIVTSQGLDCLQNNIQESKFQLFKPVGLSIKQTANLAIWIKTPI